MEYKEMGGAQMTTISTGAIEFEWNNTSSGIAIVEHTDQGLVAWGPLDFKQGS